ncbi:hypothetical protein [Geopseudomonas aromaticivorans]
MKPKRMWVNQPSTLQPDHHLHGTLVLAVPYTDRTMDAYFLEGDVSSAVLLKESLSDGWPEHLRQPKVALADDSAPVRAALAELISAVRSVNAGPQHRVAAGPDGDPCYLQRQEWVEWVLSLCDQADAVLAERDVPAEVVELSGPSL